ncbi:chemotaxis protein CheB [Thermosulfurimonas marina]|nr:chemotaxis protein CheB [Thermosulfurimonas marina]
MKKVLIIDDSPLICRILEKAIISFPDFLPVGKAANGVEALNLIEKLEPDLCTLDVNMPAMDGLSLLKKLMVRRPMPVLMVSALTKEGSKTAFEALRYGALDFLTKPGGLWEAGGTFEKVLQDKLRRVSAVDLSAIRFITRKSLKKRPLAEARPARSLIVGLGKEGMYTLLLRLLSFVEEVRAPQVWYLDLPEALVEAFAEYLAAECALPVKALVSGEVLREGFLYLTSTDKWLKLEEDHEGRLIVKKSERPRNVSGEEALDAFILEAVTLLGPRVMVIVGSGRLEKGKLGVAEVQAAGGKVIVLHRKICLYPEGPIFFAEGGRYPEVSLETAGQLLSKWPERGERDVSALKGQA